MAQVHPRTRRFHVLMSTVELVAMTVFPLALLAATIDVIAGFARFGVATAWVVLLWPLGVVGAALATGFLHVVADNFGDEKTPLLGPAFVFRFRQHHEHPGIICTLSFRELNAPAITLCTPILLVLALWVPTDTTRWGLAATSTGVVFLVFGAFTNQIHRFAHARRPCHPIIRALQRSGLLLRPEHHAVHHRAPHDVHFSITNGWLDPWLDRTGAWHLAARMLVALGARQAPESVLGPQRPRPGATAARCGTETRCGPARG